MKLVAQISICDNSNKPGAKPSLNSFLVAWMKELGDGKYHSL